MPAPAYAELREQVVVVTGAGRGIGRAVAIGFAEQGCAVVVNDLTADAAAETVEACTRAGATSSTALAADVGDAAASRAMIDEVLARIGRIDVLVSNAAINPVSTSSTSPTRPGPRSSRSTCGGCSTAAGRRPRRWQSEGAARSS